MNLTNALELGEFIEYKSQSFTNPKVRVNLDPVMPSFDEANRYRREQLAALSRNFSPRPWLRASERLVVCYFRAGTPFPTGRGDFADAGLRVGRACRLPRAGGRFLDDVACALSGSSAPGAGQEGVGEPELMGIRTA